MKVIKHTFYFRPANSRFKEEEFLVVVIDCCAFTAEIPSATLLKLEIPIFV